MFLRPNVYSSRGWTVWLLGCASTLHLSVCLKLEEEELKMYSNYYLPQLLY